MASSEFQKKASGMLVTVLIGLIVISFMFSGYQSFKFSSDSVGSVGDYPIKAAEYQNELNGMVRYYSKMMGGRNLTSKDIERFGLKQQVIRKIINMKLQLTLTDYLHITPSTEEIADQIQKLPYFLDKGVFSIDKYKNLLRANGLTPQSFEKTVIEDMKIKTLQNSFGKIPLSQAYLANLKKFKKEAYNSVIIQFSTDDVRKNYPVNSKEVKSFLAKKDNMAKLEKLFNERKTSLTKPEEIEASHILFKVDKEHSDKEAKKEAYKLYRKLTTKNFATMAKKYSQGPSKDKGGSLGRFGKKSMVKEFTDVAFSTPAGRISKPVKTKFGWHIIYVQKKYKAYTPTLAKEQTQLAKELIRNEIKPDLIKAKRDDISTQLVNLLNNNNTKKAVSLANKYNLKNEENQSFNKLDGYTGKLTLNGDIIADIYKADLSKKNVFVMNPQNKVTIAYITQAKAKVDEAKNEQYILAGQEFLLTKTLMADMLGALEKKVKVNVRKNILN